MKKISMCLILSVLLSTLFLQPVMALSPEKSLPVIKTTTNEYEDVTKKLNEKFGTFIIYHGDGEEAITPEEVYEYFDDLLSDILEGFENPNPKMYSDKDWDPIRQTLSSFTGYPYCIEDVKNGLQENIKEKTLNVTDYYLEKTKEKYADMAKEYVDVVRTDTSFVNIYFDEAYWQEQKENNYGMTNMFVENQAISASESSSSYHNVIDELQFIEEGVAICVSYICTHYGANDPHNVGMMNGWSIWTSGAAKLLQVYILNPFFNYWYNSNHSVCYANVSGDFRRMNTIEYGYVSPSLIFWLLKNI